MGDYLHHANVGIAVAAVIMIVGAFLFRNSGETALELVGITSFVGALVAYFISEERARRRSERRSQ